MSGEHTPAPWPQPEYDNSDTGPSSWWDVPGIARYIANEADARLIAAAPETAAERDRLRAEKAELVAMLKRIIAAADENCPHIEGKPWRTPKCERDYDDCIALIAKATAEGGE